MLGFMPRHVLCQTAASNSTQQRDTLLSSSSLSGFFTLVGSHSLQLSFVSLYLLGHPSDDVGLM